jgi:hypothetical protein
MVVLVEDAAKAVSSVDLEVGEATWISDRLRQRREGSGIGDALVGPMGVVERLVLA